MAGRLPEPVRAWVASWRARYRAWKNALTQRQQRLWETFQFLSLFLVLAGPFYLVLNSGWDAALLRGWNAAVTVSLLNLVGVPAAGSGSLVTVQDFVLDVSRDSTGWKSVLAFTALVIAARKPLKKTVIGVGGGVMVILVANIVRLTTMIYGVTVFNLPYETLHTVLWRWGLTLVVLVTWMVWLTGWPRWTPLQRFLNR